MANTIQKLVPDANVSFAHGQMKERELEKIMYGFINGEIDVLVSTTIIETGLDISNVNTMIIHDSDQMGLSQLYQLTVNRLADHFFIVFTDKGLDRLAILRCFLEHTHIPDADQAHMHGTRNRCRRQCQNIHIFL